MIRAFFIIILSITPGVAQERCLRLPEAVDAALDSSPQVVVAGSEREVARSRVLAARSRNSPQFNIFAQAGIGEAQPIDTVRDDQVGIRGNWELYSFGQRQAAIQEARQTLRAAQAGELEAQNDLAEQVILLYYEALRTSRIADLQRAQTEGYAREAETITKRLDRGLVTRSDARQIEARYAASLAEQELAELRRDQNLAELSVMTDIEATCVEEASALSLGQSLAEVLGRLNPTEALILAENSAYAMLRARARVRSAEARLRGANRAGLPTLSLTAFVLGEYNDSDLPIDDRWSQEDRIGFSVRQDIFTGGRLKAERAESRARLRGASGDLAIEKQRLEMEVRRSVLGVQRQGAVAARRQAASFAAFDRLEATALELERGTKTITDFVLANDDYYRTAIDEVAASWARDQELVHLASLTGLLLEIDYREVREPGEEIRLPE